MSAAPLPARAESPRVVGRLQGSGLVFKDTLQIESFDDPKVQGVTLYISNFERPITERLTSNFLQDPSYASVVRRRTRVVFVVARGGLLVEN
jgi:catabolite regulation protein CreA